MLLFMSISVSRQVSSLGVVTCGCHTTTHLRCNGEVLPETRGTLILIIVRLPCVGSSIVTRRITKTDFSTMVVGNPARGYNYMDSPQNKTFLYVVCGNLLKFGDI